MLGFIPAWRQARKKSYTAKRIKFQIVDLIMHDKVCRRLQRKALDMFDRRLHEILLKRRATLVGAVNPCVKSKTNQLHTNSYG